MYTSNTIPSYTHAVNLDYHSLLSTGSTNTVHANSPLQMIPHSFPCWTWPTTHSTIQRAITIGAVIFEYMVTSHIPFHPPVEHGITTTRKKQVGCMRLRVHKHQEFHIKNTVQLSIKNLMDLHGSTTATLLLVTIKVSWVLSHDISLEKPQRLNAWDTPYHLLYRVFSAKSQNGATW